MGSFQHNPGKQLLPTNPEPSVKSFKALKGVQRLKATKVKSGERDALERLFSLFTSEEQTAYGANWRLRYRESADKFIRVVADIESAIREGSELISAAAVANIRWREFQPRTIR